MSDTVTPGLPAMVTHPYVSCVKRTGLPRYSNTPVCQLWSNIRLSVIVTQDASLLTTITPPHVIFVYGNSHICYYAPNITALLLNRTVIYSCIRNPGYFLQSLCHRRSISYYSTRITQSQCSVDWHNILLLVPVRSDGDAKTV